MLVVVVLPWVPADADGRLEPGELGEERRAVQLRRAGRALGVLRPDRGRVDDLGAGGDVLGGVPGHRLDAGGAQALDVGPAVARSEPVTSAPSVLRDQREAGHPGAADPDEVQPAPVHRRAASSTSAAMSAAASGVRAGARPPPSARSRAGSATSSPTARARRWAVSSRVADHHRGARLLHPARVGRLVVGRRVRVRDEHRRQPVLGELEDRAARARDREVGGGQRAAERRHVVAQVVVRRRATSRVGEVAAAGDVQDAERRVGERLERGGVDRPRAERAAEDEHAQLVRRRYRTRARAPARSLVRRRDRPPRDAVARRLAGPRSGRPGRRGARGARAAGW